MNLTLRISSSEKRLIKHLELFFKSHYPDDTLVSHGLLHHRRVWDYAKDLIKCVYREKEMTDPLLTDKLLIACYLHDIGMTIETGEKHGCHSRAFCEIFLTQNNLDNSLYADVLQAVEDHDNKEFTGNAARSEILNILTTADDLDAFGMTGVERYLEIYRLRGITGSEAGARILENSHNRFRNFEQYFGKYPELFEKHKNRYMILVDHFSSCY